jgi:tetratricopeptide (TPR) repeat protein
MKTCYVSTPFGIKIDLSGSSIDFDRIYFNVVKPAVTDAGLLCSRADELPSGALIHKAVLSAILSSDVMIVDITTSNPNVMYELGVRHAARRGVTILLMGRGSQIPYDITYSKIIFYSSGGIDEEGSLRVAVGNAIKDGLGRIVTDSPLYEFFPDLNLELPGELISSESRRRIFPKRSFKKGLVESERSPSQELALAAAALNLARNTPDIDPVAFVNLLKLHRDNSAWDEMIELYEELPAEVQRSTEVLQLLALALNRRAKPKDRDRAIDIMKQLISETGGDAESYGILGRIHKDLYTETGSRVDLESAIEYYKSGFEKQPTDFYPGVNVITLLLQHPDPIVRQEVDQFLPRVREAVENRIKEGPVGFWELATALHLACIAREWGEAEKLARGTLEKSPPRWMLESTLRDLEALTAGMSESDRSRLQSIIAFLRKGFGAEGLNA